MGYINQETIHNIIVAMKQDSWFLFREVVTNSDVWWMFGVFMGLYLIRKFFRNAID